MNEICVEREKTYRKMESFIAKLPKFCNIKIETFI